MASMSPAQVAEMIQAVTQAVIGSMAATAVPPRSSCVPDYRGSGGQISGRHLHLKKFKGDLSQWDHWSWAFKNIITGQNAIIANGMTGAETAGEEVDQDVEIAEELKQHSAEFYSLLFQMLEGEALTILRTVPRPHGIRAWQILLQKIQSPHNDEGD